MKSAPAINTPARHPVIEPLHPANDRAADNDNPFDAGAKGLWEWAADDWINDAEIWGVLTDEIANLPIVVSGASKHTATSWKTTLPTPFGTVFTNQFSTHKVGEKAGRCLVMGALGSGGKRSKSNVTALYMMGLDIDNGARFAATAERIGELGYTAILYSTHSNGKGTVEIKRDDYMRWAKLDRLHGEPSIVDAQAYLRFLGRYEDFVIDGIFEITTAHDGAVNFVCSTTPFDKFRVLFPLAAPLVIREQAQMQAAVLREWSHKVIGLGQKLGVTVDRAAVDPSRVFFLPRHPEGAENFRIVLNCGRLLPYEEIPVSTSDSDPFASAGNGMGSRERIVTADGFDLNTWCAKHGHEFDIAQLFNDLAPERIRQDQGNDKLSIACPTEHLHSEPGKPDDLGCYVQSAGMSAEDFAFGCSHNGCQAHGRDRLKMLCAAINAGWFPSAALTKGIYLVESGDAGPADNGGTIEAARFGSKQAQGMVLAKAFETVDQMTKLTLDEDVQALLKTLVVLSEREAERVLAVIKSKTGTPIGSLRHDFEDLCAKASHNPKSPYHFETLDAGIAALNKEIAMVERGTDVMIVQKRDEADGWKTIRAAETVFAPWKVGAGSDMEPLFPLWKGSHLRDYRTDVVCTPYRYGTADPTPGEHYNLYKGLAVEPVAGDWMSFQRHVFHVICNGDMRLFRFFMGWMADLFQSPATKPGTALLLHGLKGTGKSLFTVPLHQILGLGNSVKVNNRKHLTGNFNAHMAGKLLVTAEESFWGGDKEADSSLKDQITSEVVLLENKFADPVPTRDSRRFIIISNAKSVVRATPDERRYAATVVSDARIGDAAYFDALAADIYGGKTASAMLHDLLELDISDIDLRRPPKTAALIGQIINALPADERWIRGVLQSGSFTGAASMDLLDERTSEMWLTESIQVTKEMVRESYQSAVKPYGGGQVGPGEIGKFFVDKFKDTEAEIDDTRPGRGKREYVLPPLPDMVAAYERKWTPLDPDTAEDERDFIRVVDKNDPDECRQVAKDADDFINALFMR